ncbi:hypothetical protein EMCRGX_G014809 [Ephydatia muelleri]
MYGAVLCVNRAHLDALDQSALSFVESCDLDACGYCAWCCRCDLDACGYCTWFCRLWSLGSFQMTSNTARLLSGCKVSVHCSGGVCYSEDMVITVPIEGERTRD